MTLTMKGIFATRAKTTAFLLSAVSGMFILVLIVAAIANLPPFGWIRWRLHNEGEIAFHGHLFEVPVLWTSSPESDGQMLFRQYWFGGVSCVSLRSADHILDEPAAINWQAEHVSFLNSRSSNHEEYSSELNPRNRHKLHLHRRETA
jgi:hypothetical protein